MIVGCKLLCLFVRDRPILTASLGQTVFALAGSQQGNKQLASFPPRTKLQGEATEWLFAKWPIFLYVPSLWLLALKQIVTNPCNALSPLPNKKAVE